jgi:pyruvate kinase
MYADREYQPGTNVQLALTRSSMVLAEDVGATAIVVETKSGATARLIASHRPILPIIVVTSDIRVAQQCALLYGSKSYVRKDDKMAASKLTQWLRTNNVLSKGEIVVIVAGRYPGVIGTTDTIKVRVLE